MKVCSKCDSGYHDSHTTCPTHGGVLGEIRELKPGMLIHKTYRIVRKLGQGGMGIVYLANHVFMEEQRALKFLSADLSQDAAFTGRFRREVRTLRQIRHKNVVDCSDLEPAEDDSLFFAMEFVDGPDLGDFLREAPKPLDVGLALTITRGIAEGLGAAHALGMVHRDIKPENILMTSIGQDWVPKIADFGIVATRESGRARTQTGGTLLSLAYAAPEQWRGTRSADLDGRTDLYSLGGVLFQMLTGETVFDAENYEGWAWQHQQAVPRAPSSIRPELAYWRGLDALVLRLLAKDAAGRPRDVAEFLVMLNAVQYVAPSLPRKTAVEFPPLMPPPLPMRTEPKKTEPKRTELEKPIIYEPPAYNPPSEKKGLRRIPVLAWAGGIVLLIAGVFAAAHIFGPKPPDPSSETVSQSQPSDNSQPTGGDSGSSSAQPAPQTTPATSGSSTGTGTNSAQPDASASTKPDSVSTNDAKDTGVTYYNQKRYTEAAPYFDQACNGDNAFSCDMLGVMYDIGDGVHQDYYHAVRLYTKACNLGEAWGCSNLGTMYEAGHGIGQDYGMAVKLFTSACDRKEDVGCTNLGESYRYGHGVDQDMDKARTLLKEGCDLGDSHGCDVLKEIE